jgi:hypothetical protein
VSAAPDPAARPPPPFVSAGRFIDLEGLRQETLPHEVGPDGTPTFPFVLVSMHVGDDAPPPTRLLLYAASEGARTAWTAAVDAALALWAGHGAAAPLATTTLPLAPAALAAAMDGGARAEYETLTATVQGTDGLLRLRSSVFDQFGLVRRVSSTGNAVGPPLAWCVISLAFNCLHYSSALSLYEHERALVLDGCYVAGHVVPRNDGSGGSDYVLDLLERTGADGGGAGEAATYALQMRDADELTAWADAIAIAAHLTQDVPFAAVYQSMYLLSVCVHAWGWMRLHVRVCLCLCGCVLVCVRTCVSLFLFLSLSLSLGVCMCVGSDPSRARQKSKGMGVGRRRCRGWRRCCWAPGSGGRPSSSTSSTYALTAVRVIRMCAGACAGRECAHPLIHRQCDPDARTARRRRVRQPSCV